VRRLFFAGLIATTFLLVTTAESCDGGKTAAKETAEWISKWRDGPAVRAGHPTGFRIPPPPAIKLETAASETKNDLTEASHPFETLRKQTYDETSEHAGEYTKEVICSWFSWYVEDPSHTVPDEATFFKILLESGLKVTLRAPPSQQVQEATVLLRNAILRAKGNSSEVTRNEAVAAACSVPLPT
jgi:ornithine carbamoyltransferase